MTLVACPGTTFLRFVLGTFVVVTCPNGRRYIYDDGPTFENPQLLGWGIDHFIAKMLIFRKECGRT